jgi:hypothetical protein
MNALDNLNENPEYVAVPRQQVMVIDKIVEKLKNNESGTVETQDDWDAVVLLFDLFRLEHTGHYNWFIETIKEYRKGTTSNHGIVKDDAGDMVQHMLEIPEVFHQYMHRVFPNQKWDKKFIRKLTTELPILKVADQL